MKRKPNFWRLLPKTAPYILALMFWRYSNLSARETAMIIAASAACYGIIMAVAGVWVETEGKD